jgi:hypothetical protein
LIYLTKEKVFNKSLISLESKVNLPGLINDYMDYEYTQYMNSSSGKNIKEEDLMKLNKNNNFIRNSKRTNTSASHIIKLETNFLKNNFSEEIYLNHTEPIANKDIDKNLINPKIKKRKNFFNFNNLDALSKQLDVFKSLPKSYQDEIIKFELQPNTNILKINKNKNTIYSASKVPKDMLKINRHDYFNRVTSVHKNFKESSVIWPMIKTENMHKVMNAEEIFENILKK